MTNSSENHWYNDIGHTVTRLICQGIYFMMGSVYDIICQIADSPIISSESILKFYNRVQLIIGVFMMFRLAVTIIQGIIDPDKFTDAKAGIGNVITKIITALAILTLIIPLQNIPDNVKLNSLENRMKKDGILFGAMYELQSRLIADDGSGNVLIKLVIGPSEDVSRVRSAGQNLATIVLKSFFTPNLKEGSDNKDFLIRDKKSKQNGQYKHEYLYCAVYDDQDNFTNQCSNSSDEDCNSVRDAYAKYYKKETSTTDILNMVNTPCEVLDSDKQISGWDAYAFNFNWFAGLIVGLLFLFMLVMLCIEVAKRAIKLAILRLISPIPIISYMSPGSTFENGPMGAWVKTTTKTYIELFINLLVIYFAFFVIKEIEANNGLIFSDTISGSAGIFAKIFVYIGLILFAKDAPKFIKQALGVKDEGGFFSGIKGTMAGLGAMAGTAAGLGVAVGGGIGSMATNFRASRQEHPFQQGQGIRNVGRAALAAMSGIAGGFSGAAVGAKAAVTSKNKKLGASMDAMNQRNATRLNQGGFVRRKADSFENLVTGGINREDRMITQLQENLKPIERQNKAASAMSSAVKKHKALLAEEALKQTNLTGSYTFADGRELNMNVANLKQKLQGSTKDTIIARSNGKAIRAGDIDENVIAALTDSQAVNFEGTDAYNDNAKVQQSLAEVAYAAETAGIAYDGTYDSAGKTIGAANSAALDTQKQIDSINKQITDITESAGYRRRQKNK